MRLKRTFVELPAFSRLVSEKHLSDQQVAGVQDSILNGGGKALGQTGGIKKIRCEDLAKGKSGGWRVLFADYDRYGITVLIWAFPKNRQANLTQAQKKAIRNLKLELDHEMSVKYGPKK